MLENQHPPEGTPMSTKIKRTFTLICLFLLVVIISAGLLGLLTIRRSYPQIEGTLSIPGLSGEVEIIRDSLGIPHIYASNETDLFMAQGYVHAQDRFFQMDLWRHTGAGRLSEMFGESQIDTDKFLRTMGWERIAEEELSLIDAETESILQAYADGVNAYLSDHTGADLSLEYVVLKLLAPSYSPAPWQPINTMTWAKVMAFDLSGNSSGWEDLERASVYNQLGESQADVLYPTYPENHPLILPDPPFEETYLEDHAQWAWLQSLSSNSQPISLIWQTVDTMPGSNSWVVSGDRTTTGAPILANDPHLGIQMPSIWYEVGLHCQPVSESCRFNVTGFSFAGAPGVIIGHNDRIAWGFTNVGPDVLDLYIEKINPQNPNQYEVNGDWEDMLIIEEEIQVAGGEPVTLTVRNTRHGPIFSDVDERFDTLSEMTNLAVPSPYAVSVRWTALETSFIFKSIIKMDLAQNWDQFRDALRDFDSPSQNMIYADVDGNIGYQTPGRIPIRASGDGVFPVPGWIDDYEWTGYIPFDELPSSFNPPQGFIVTANNAIVGSDYPYSISKTWDLGYRAQRIVEFIQAHPTLSIEDMQTLQGDGYHAMGALLVPILLDLPFEDAHVGDLVGSLESWDYQNDGDSSQAAIFNAFWRQLLIATLGDTLGEDIPSGCYAFLIIEHLVDEPQNAWWDDVDTVIRSCGSPFQMPSTNLSRISGRIRTTGGGEICIPEPSRTHWVWDYWPRSSIGGLTPAMGVPLV
jgi:penicillin amidase